MADAAAGSPADGRQGEKPRYQTAAPRETALKKHPDLGRGAKGAFQPASCESTSLSVPATAGAMSTS